MDFSINFKKLEKKKKIPQIHTQKQIFYLILVKHVSFSAA